MKKILALVACLSLVASLAIGGSIAYLTDRDSEANVFTMGNVEIDLTEEFEQGSSFVPGTTVDKKPTITNTGDTSAYVWMTVAVPEDFTAIKIPGGTEEQIECTDAIFPMLDTSNTDWVIYHDAPLTDEIDGKTYALMTLLYTKALAPKESTSEIFEKVAISKYIDINTDGSMYFVFNGEVTPIAWNINDAGNPTVYVSAYAIQTEGFENVEAAYAAYNTQWGQNGTEYAAAADIVDSVEELMTSLGNGKDVAVDGAMETIHYSDTAIDLDAQGATVTLKGVGTEAGVSSDYGYLGFVPPAGENVAVENLNVTGSGFVELGHYGQGGGTYTAKNLNVTNMTPTLKVTDGSNKVAAAFSHYGTATLTDCVMTGVKSVEGYNTYDAGFVHKTNTTIEGGKYGKIYLWSQAHVTINNAEVDQIDSTAITTRNLGMLTIGAGTHVGTINLIPAGTYTPALTIESGATVDKIVYQGTEYTQAEWANR